MKRSDETKVHQKVIITNLSFAKITVLVGSRGLNDYTDGCYA